MGAGLFVPRTRCFGASGHQLVECWLGIAALRKERTAAATEEGSSAVWESALVRLESEVAA